MKYSPDALFLDFPGSALASPYYPSEKPNFLVSRILLVATVLLFALVSWPKTAALEPVLTAENMLLLINQDRQETGSTALTLNSQLQQAALLKAQDILAHNYFAHISPSGTTPWDFIKKTGLPYTFAGENLALNYLSAYELENDFLKSPSHRENLLSPLFSQIGMAVVPGAYQGQNAIIIVQMFAD